MVRERADRGEGAKAQAAPPGGLSIIEIRQLLKLMDSSDLEELVIEQGQEGLKLTLRKPTPVVAAYLDDDGEGYDGAELGAGEAQAIQKDIEIVAPLVGIFRSSMKPGGKPLVAVGDIVREGQVVAAIESLNVHNDVEATTSGRVREITMQDGQAVEYGQPLIILDPLNV